MKILIINVCCGIRSTGRICTDLATSLLNEGHEVKIAYGRGMVPDKYKKFAIKIGQNRDIVFHVAKARMFDADGLGSKSATRKFIKWLDDFNPDVIHLHNIHGYYMNVPMVFQYIIGHKKKLIWTLHDMWSFTGHSCTCDEMDCEKWKIGCGKCPLYRKYPASFVDRSAYNYEWKKELFSSVEDLTLVSPSKWLAHLVRKSFLGKNKMVVIPNGIDTSVFKPLQNDLKKHFGIEDKILLLGCAAQWSKEKGLYDFYELSKKIDERYKIVIVGLNKKQIRSLPSNIIGIERTNSIKELTQIYNAADLFINLSYADNYPTVILEALSCGTPVITYETGGSAECLYEENGRCFKCGDLFAIINFLNKEYTPGMFSVKSDINLNKNVSVKAYINEMCGGGYWKIRDKYKMYGRIVILGVAAFWTSRKGAEVFVKLAKELTEEYMIVMVGTNKKFKSHLSLDIIMIEKTNDQDELRQLYSVADVFLNPTTQDNYPTVNLEAVACGTPVITYDTGGSSENSYTPTCVVAKGDYDRLKTLILSRQYENALSLDSIDTISKEKMYHRYANIY